MEGISFTPQTLLNYQVELDNLNSTKQDKIGVITTTLAASNWNANSQQTLSIQEFTIDKNAIIGLANDLSNEQEKAAVKAKLKVTTQTTGSLTIEATGIVPTIDLPVVIMIM